MDSLADEVTYPKFDFNPYACMSLKGLYWEGYGQEDGVKIAAIRECIYAFGQAIEEDTCFYRLSRREHGGMREHYAYVLKDVGAVAMVTANDYSLVWKLIPQNLLTIEEAVIVLRIAAQAVRGPHKAQWFKIYRALQMVLLNVPDGAMVGFTSKPYRVNFSISWPKGADRVVLAVTTHVPDGFDTQE
jgi:hypothetical protein